MVQGIWSGQSGDGGSLLCSTPFLLGSIEASSWLPADQSGGYHQGQTSFAS